MKQKHDEKIGRLGLTAFVLSAMVGGGIYDLPQNMAMHAGVIGQVGAWLVTGLIIGLVVRSFLILSQVRPQYTTGLYHYAQAGFGKFTAFFVSWGYWICQTFAIAAYAVLLTATLNVFWPGMFSGGNNWQAVIVGSVILWTMIFLITRGIQTTSRIDLVGTVCMLVIVAVFICSMLVAFHWKIFWQDPLGTAPHSHFKLGNPLQQVQHSLLTTLWVFSGVESAVVLSKKSKSQQAVRHATRDGFLICLGLYAAVSILPLGVRSYEQVAGMSSPSTAVLLGMVLGTTGRLLITFGVIIAVLASWLSWILVLAEIPMAAAVSGTFPRWFGKINHRRVPIPSLLATGAIIQIIIIFTHFSTAAFNTTLTIVATMTIPPYLISMLFLVKISAHERTFNPQHEQVGVSRKTALITAVLASLGTLFMGYTAGLWYINLAFIIYALGIPLFIWTRHHDDPHQPIFGKFERWFALLIVAVAVGGLLLLLEVV
ncbi:amino acid permease [Fructilactobacillus florum]|uniref:Histidine histamine antiporter n=1 Tax=Fructilactobacillus florum DSM 22689 = JCM 16035 TaxID=1423745 RepID=A0A0R2CLF9_9LACO|nr:amino acid permease [Fructilactobacillus florum]KRM92477.1 histidine histamine antiporter [Fructilactobacillus florum DSM 22689 = JCM 16035]